ncbi:MAG: cytochrome c [Flavobacterium sp.]|nr:cytochrome c [Flavobacterium sp.]
MKKLVVSSFIICLAILYACNNDAASNASKYLNPNNLAVQTFTINTSVHNNIVTKQGIKISIAKGTIEAASQNVTLEIKEALSLDAMLKAGLTTQTKNGILSTEGMFYIATKEASTIKKPIAINVPTAFANTSMQLYKGKNNNGKIVWETPTPITTKASEQPNGRDIFKTNCASCHAIGKSLTGPDLAWIENRWPNRKLLYAYIRNNINFIHRYELEASINDTTKGFLKAHYYACCVYNKYNGLAMTSISLLSDKEIDDLIAYINNCSKKLNVPETFNPSADCDSCWESMNTYVALLNKRDSLAEDNKAQTKITVIEPSDANPNNDNGTIPTKISPPIYNAEYYQFQIIAYGWYNIDDLIAGKFGSVPSELTVALNGEGKDKAQVFLIIPSIKVFTEGGKLSDEKRFGFYVNDGKLPLPQGYNAFVFAISESQGQTYYGRTSFITSTMQDLKIQMKRSEKETILKEMDELKLDKFEMKINKTKNFDNLKSLDSSLSNLVEMLRKCPCLTNQIK